MNKIILTAMIALLPACAQLPKPESAPIRFKESTTCRGEMTPLFDKTGKPDGYRIRYIGECPPELQ